MDPSSGIGSARTAQHSMRLAPINGLRGIAILGVLYFHVIAGIWSADGMPAWLSPLLTNTWTGVNLFFILSGFVLFLPYAANPQAMGGTEHRIEFYRRRALRLLPLFYIAAAALWAIEALRGASGLGDLLTVATFRFIADAKEFEPALNPPLWSIGVEVAFSALFPILVLVSRRAGMLRIVLAVLAVALAMRLAGYMRYAGAEAITFNTDMFVCRLDEFVLGMAAAQLYHAGRLPRHAGRTMLAGAALVLAAWIGYDLSVRHVFPGIARAPINDVLDAGLFLVVLAALIPGARPAAALSWRPLQVLGMMCYSLYIWHWPILHWLMPDRASLPASGFAVGVPCYFVLTLAIAALTYRFVEFGRVREWRRLFLIDAPRPMQPITPSPGLMLH